jgi:hypothetical protein
MQYTILIAAAFILATIAVATLSPFDNLPHRAPQQEANIAPPADTAPATNDESSSEEVHGEESSGEESYDEASSGEDSGEEYHDEESSSDDPYESSSEDSYDEESSGEESFHNEE